MRMRGWPVMALAVLGLWALPAAAAEPVKIAVFGFELEDKSAGGGIIAQDAIDSENLKLATAEAQSLLRDSGRYAIVDVAGAALPEGGLRHCNGCEAGLAARLGAERSMVGVITRVNRTEYTLQVLVRDAATGAVISNDFTGLRMGANYSWPRGAKSLVKNKMLAAK